MSLPASRDVTVNRPAPPSQKSSYFLLPDHGVSNRGRHARRVSTKRPVS